ncbi:MAG: hypothetical protein U0797_00265 [Gemmataceae bacterium]
MLNAIRAQVPWAGGDGCDAELLARFVGRRGEAVFSDLVARHGTMVFGGIAIPHRLPRRPRGGQPPAFLRDDLLRPSLWGLYF